VRAWLWKALEDIRNVWSGNDGARHDVEGVIEQARSRHGLVVKVIAPFFYLTKILAKDEFSRSSRKSEFGHDRILGQAAISQ